MGQLRDDPTLINRSYIFADRTEAGGRLAEMLRDFKDKPFRLFAIPAGGVPVAAAIARLFGF